VAIVYGCFFYARFTIIEIILRIAFENPWLYFFRNFQPNGGTPEKQYQIYRAKRKVYQLLKQVLTPTLALSQRSYLSIDFVIQGYQYLLESDGSDDQNPCRASMQVPVSAAITDQPQIPCRIYFPLPPDSVAQASSPTPILFYFHGGGFVLGGLDSHDATCSALSKACHVVVIAVDYRLAPEYIFPAGLNDCLSVVQSIHACKKLRDVPDIFQHISRKDAQYIDSLVLDFKKLYICGDSAGGSLCIATTLLAQDLKLECSRDIRHIFPIYPCADTRFINTSCETARGLLLSNNDIKQFYMCYTGMTKNELQDYLLHFDNDYKHSKRYTAIQNEPQYKWPPLPIPVCLKFRDSASYADDSGSQDSIATKSTAAGSLDCDAHHLHSPSDHFLRRCATIRSPYFHVVGHPRIMDQHDVSSKPKVANAKTAKDTAKGSNKSSNKGGTSCSNQGVKKYDIPDVSEFASLPPATFFVCKHDPLLDEGVEIAALWRKRIHLSSSQTSLTQPSQKSSAKTSFTRQSVDECKESVNVVDENPSNIMYFDNDTHGFANFPFLHSCKILIERIRIDITNNSKL
jgi:acetyl esterase/lipase